MNSDVSSGEEILDDSTSPAPQEGTQESLEDTASQESNPELGRLRQEAAKYRTERNDLKKRLEELEGAGKTEVEKLTGKVSEYERTLDSLEDSNRRLRAQVIGAKVGIASEARADAAALLDWSAISDPNSDEEVESALKKLVKAKPYLSGKSNSGVDAGRGGSRETSQDMNSLLRSAAGRE
jgi:predicted RNase H-like nuclease (RuvC/YqgF family)